MTMLLVALSAILACAPTRDVVRDVARDGESQARAACESIAASVPPSDASRAYEACLVLSGL